MVGAGAGGALAPAGAGARTPLVGQARPHEHHLGALVEASGDRAIPERGRDTAGCGARDEADQRSASRRPRRCRGLPRAHGEHVAHPHGAGPPAAARADRPGVLCRDVTAVASRRRRASAAAAEPRQRSSPAPSRRICGPSRGARVARAPDGARRPPGPRGAHSVGARTRELSASGIGRRPQAPRDRRHLGGSGAGRTVARHDRRCQHAADRDSRPPGQCVVGPTACGARVDALRRAGPQRVARGGGRRRPLCTRHGANGSRPAGAGAGGVRYMSAVTTIVGTTDLTILVYFLALNSFYAVLLVLSIPEIWEQTRLAEDEDFQRLMQSDALPPITILVPAHNESATIETSVTAILTLEYRSFEVVVVNDGSKDDTLERLRHAFELYEVPRTYPEGIATRRVRAVYRSRSRTRLLVIDKENGGKADSLNAAINASRFPLVIAVDAETLIEPDALLRLTRPFLLSSRIAAVGGTVRVANGCTVRRGRVTDARVPRRFLPGVQVVEYLRAFLFGRLGWNRLGGSLVISGAFGLFRKEYLHAIGGYRVASVVEDLDLVVRLHRHLRQRRSPYEITFIPDPVAWTEVPESGRILSRQRERWHRGLIAAMWLYKGMLFNPRYGRVGLIAMPFFAFGEALAPLIEVVGYVITLAGFAVGQLDVAFALLFLLVAWGYGMLLSLWAVVLEEVSFRRYRRAGGPARLLAYATLENFGYRQRTVWWRLKAFFTVWKHRQSWGEMTRKGFETVRQQVDAQAPRR